MPYDPRRVSEGGNRGIDEKFSRKAPSGKYRVVGVDTFDGTDWKEGDFDTLEQAVAHIVEESKGKQMQKMYIYNDKGKFVDERGTF
jgi:hypothetical protein